MSDLGKDRKGADPIEWPEDLRVRQTERRPLTLWNLSPRQRSIALLIARGLSAKEIAMALGLAPGTIKIYTANIYKNLGLDNRVKLARWVIEQKGL